MKKICFFLLMLVVPLAVHAQLDPSKKYTIANNNDPNAYIQEHNATGGTIVAVGALSELAYWKFEATDNADCYYVKNTVTGKYLQGYASSGDEISSGDTPVEYCIKADANGSYAGKYRLAVTSLSPHDFTNDFTLGLNWKGASDASVDYDCIQAFASAAGGRPRSAWIITEVPEVFDPDKTFTIVNNNDANAFIQEHDATGGGVVAVGAISNRAYWKFESTGNDHCYYVKNALTGKYLQGYTESGDEISSGDSPVEYCIKADATGTLYGKYRLAVTSLTPHDFSGGTLGLNWEEAKDWEGDYDCIQAFASVVGENPRSAWIIAEGTMPEEPPTFSIDANKKYTLHKYAEDGYLKDDRSGIVRVESDLTSNALWQLEATSNEDCYYLKNILTGKYVQACAEAFDQNNEAGGVKMGEEPVEYRVIVDANKGSDVFAFASTTDQDDFSFSGDKTKGLNWRGGSNYAQSYFANVGSNPRSFWKVAEVETMDFADTDDNASAIAVAVGTGKNTVVTRTAAKDMWNTLVVPHAMNEYAIARNFGAEARVAELTSQSEGALAFTTVTAIEAGKPYLVKPSVDVVNIITLNTTVAAGLTPAGEGDYQFIGLYAPAAIGANDYFMAAGSTLMKGSGTMKAFRAYFHPTSSQAKALTAFDVDDTATGIILPDGQFFESTKMYNLAGQQVRSKNVQRGIYIINGKKAVVK